MTLAMPYVDFNPQSRGPNWHAYVILSVLVILNITVVGSASTRT